MPLLYRINDHRKYNMFTNKGKQKYYLVNIVSRLSTCSEMMTFDEVQKRNEWLEKYGSHNIKWLDENELNKLQAN